MVSTFYAGIEAGGSAGASITFPLPYQNPSLGWKKAIEDGLNGVTLIDILSR